MESSPEAEYEMVTGLEDQILDCSTGDDVCRICATTNEYLITIFEGEGLENDLCGKINSLLPITVSREDELTHLICYQCASHILAWNDLRQCAAHADKHLRDILKRRSQIDDEAAEIEKQINVEEVPVVETEIETVQEENKAIPNPATRLFATLRKTPTDGSEYTVYSEILLMQSDDYSNAQLNLQEDSERAHFIFRNDMSNIIIEEADNLHTLNDEKHQKSHNVVNVCNVNNPHSDVEYFHILNEEKQYDSNMKNDFDVYGCTEENPDELQSSSTLNIVLAERYPDKDDNNEEQESLDTNSSEARRSKCDSSNDFAEQVENCGNITADQHKETPGNIISICTICDESFESPEKFQVHHKLCSRGVAFIKTKVISYICWICNNEFSSKEGLTEHKEVHVKSDGRLQCPYCDTTCMNNKYLKTHLHLHNSPKTYQCEICHKNFKRKSNMESHLANHVNDFPCSVCFNSYNTQFCLSRHLAIHSEDEINSSKIRPTLLVCGFAKDCREKFDSKLKYFMHKKTHMNIVDYKCDKCNKSYKSPSILANHKKIHESTCECTSCGKVLSNHKTLKEHMRLHTGEMPYECKFCNQKFRCQSFLAVHVLTHTGVRNYKCRFCQHAFTRSNYLKEHLRTHTNDKPFVCKYCNQGYTQSSVLNKHVATMHRKCDICDEMIGDKTKLQVHKWKLHSNKEMHNGDNSDMFVLNDGETILVGEETIVEM